MEKPSPPRAVTENTKSDAEFFPRHRSKFMRTHDNQSSRLQMSMGTDIMTAWCNPRLLCRVTIPLVQGRRVLEAPCGLPQFMLSPLYYRTFPRIASVPRQISSNTSAAVPKFIFIHRMVQQPQGFRFSREKEAGSEGGGGKAASIMRIKGWIRARSA